MAQNNHKIELNYMSKELCICNICILVKEYVLWHQILSSALMGHFHDELSLSLSLSLSLKQDCVAFYVELELLLMKS